jgi:transposase
MYIRTKKRENGKFSMQIVENSRVNGKPRQKVIRHVGTVANEDDLVELEKFAHYLKRQIEEELQPSLFDVGEVDKMNKSKSSGDRKLVGKNVLLDNLEEEERRIVGFHDVYGSLFDDIDFKSVFGGFVRNQASVNILKDLVISRIANPLSKRGSVHMLEQEFGINLDLDKVYRMMDKIDDEAIKKIKLKSLQSAKSLLNNEIDVVFYDATTLYFESFDDDDLRQKGYSKDMKFNQTQILLTILATKEGIPIGYNMFEGSFYEGHTLIKALDTIRNDYEIDKVIFVADSGLLNKDNLQLLEDNNYDYIIGAREKNTKKEIQEQILDSNNYEPISDELVAKEIKLDDKRLISVYSKKRAYKDKKDREANIEKLRKKLSKSKSSKSLISNYGYKKYLKINDSDVTLNEEKIKAEEKWDGIFTIITNSKLKPIEIITQYKSLWQIEETFRISKHNLKFRPIYHYTPKRIKAHIAICFISLTLVRNLMHRSKMQYKNLPPKQINHALKKAQISILRDRSTKKLYGLPSKVNPETIKLYQITKQTWNRTPFALQ